MKGRTTCILSVLATCFATSSCLFSNTSFSECPSTVYERVNDYNMESLSGVWYENATYYRLLGKTGKCAEIKIASLPHLLYEFKFSEIAKGQKKIYTGELMKLNHYFKFYTYVVILGKVAVTMQIMDTDYKCWAVVYYCLQHAITNKSYVSILLRSRNPDCLSSETYQAVEDVLKNEKLSLSMFKYNDQQECNY